VNTQPIVSRTHTLLLIGLVVLAVGFAVRSHAATGPAAHPATAPNAAPAGKITIGLVTPRAQLGQGAGGTDVAEPVRHTLAGYLQGPAVEIVPLESRIPAQIDAEAQQKNCAYILYSSVEQKSGGAAGLFRKLAPFASALPMLGGMGHVGGGAMAGAASAVAQSAMTASAVASQQEAMERMTGAQRSTVKSGDIITLEYRLMAPRSAEPLRADKLTAKAKSDGEDVLSPLIEQVAGAVVSATAGAGAAPSAPAGSTSASTSGGGALLPPAVDGRSHRNALQSQPPGGGQMDCDRLAGMPNSVMSADACRKMMAARVAYTTAASDPSAMHPGDERMNCADIAAEMSQMRGIGPSEAHRQEAGAAATDLQAGIHKEQAALAQRATTEQAVINAAVASDTATEVTTGGMVRPRTATVVEQGIQQRELVEGQQAAERLKPKQTRTTDAVGNEASDMGQALAANPRYARLVQLAGERNCKEPGR
jgi:hypothetical protein